MIVRNIKLSGFRNLTHFELSFSEGKNLIYGRNGAGKTSILEAIFLPAFGKSFLNVRNAEITNHDAQRFILHMDTASHYGVNRVGCWYQNKLSLLLNDKKATIFDINQYHYPVFFSSSNYNLYIENKPHTRKMMDRFIFGIDALYIRDLLSYNRVLRQKNHLLKTKQNIEQLSSWNRLIGEIAEKLVMKRKQFVARLNTEIEKKLGNTLQVQYIPSFSVDTNQAGAMPASALRESFYRQLEQREHSEIQYKRALIGPHRDSYEICLNGKKLKYFSSGEKKIHLLMVYIAFIELFKDLKREYPVFLVDDYDTAIDEGNIDLLMDKYPEIQVIATSTAVRGNRRFDRLIELKKEND